MEAVLTILSKVAVMVIMISIGFILTRKGMLTDRGASEITRIILYIVTPCLIISSFTQSNGDVTLLEMLLSAVIMTAAFVINILLSKLLFKKEPDERRIVLRFTLIFSNMGFMGMPLVQGIVGGKGVIYASFGIIVFNLFSWTYGYRMMNSQAKLSIKTILLNPGMIGILIGFPLYLFEIKLPAVLEEPISGLAALNTPLAMIIIGSYIAKVSIHSFISDKSVYKMTAFRLLIAPAIFFLLLLLIRPGPELFVSSVIQASTPVAANAVMFAVAYKKDSELASKSVAVSTVLSIVTIPLFTILAQLVTQYIY